MNSRISIRGTAMTAGTAMASVAVAAGLNVTGVIGEIAPSVAMMSAEQPRATTNVAVGGDARPEGTRDAWQRHEHRQGRAHAHKVHHEKAAKAAAAARSRRSAASRASSRSYPGDARSIARSMMASRYGWSSSQFSCINSLWNRESGWNVHAANSSSGAYGIPQALPGAKMATKGADWRDNPATQIAWGLSYVKSVYGTPCGAWSAFRSKGWY